jgi:antibiotic biosynthesis monooxygenase (ABM) superfamily enzyme
VIARVWNGATRADDGERYAEYLEQSGMTTARDLAGVRGTLVLRREHEGRAEFQTILLFDSIEDVTAFAGEQHERAVFFPEDDAYLVERDLEVRHYDVDLRLD